MNATRNVVTLVGVVLLCSVCCWAEEPVKGDVWSNLDVQFYGYIKADAVWSDSLVTTSNYLKWVDSSSRNDKQFAMTARETRFGFKVTGPEFNGWTSRGQIEMDFFDGSTENKGDLYMRHAYLAISKPEKKLTVLAGQTWDVVSPLNPKTLNYSPLWWIGNIGYRRPQIRVEKGVDLGEETSLLTQVALARTMGSSITNGTGTGALTTESGDDSGVPQIQGRVALTVPGPGPKPTTVGVSGHFGKEEHDYNTSGDSVKVDTWSGNLDVTLPLCEVCTVKGELHTGSNLSAMLGGIGQGVTGSGTSAARAVRSSGGWVAASLAAPNSSTAYNLGYGMEKICDRDVASGGRTSNRCIFGNAIYSINKYIQVGAELSYARTQYLNQSDGEAFRVQCSMILNI